MLSIFLLLLRDILTIIADAAYFSLRRHYYCRCLPPMLSPLIICWLLRGLMMPLPPF